MKTAAWIIVLGALLLAAAAPAVAQENPINLPSITIGTGDASSPEQISTAMQIVIMLTVLSLAPAILIMTTCFVRIAVTFSLLRNALGTPQVPPAQIVVGLALFLTFFIMAPVFGEVHDNAFKPYMDNKISQEQFFERAAAPMREFMLKQTRKKDLGLFMKISGEERPRNRDDITLTALVPAFVISELRTAFEIGFLLYVPFLVIDMVVASVLLSMGMMMLPPVMISLPFKLMLFVLVDGWYLVVGSLVRSFA